MGMDVVTGDELASQLELSPRDKLEVELADFK